jgi:hypothetical protein
MLNTISWHYKNPNWHVDLAQNRSSSFQQVTCSYHKISKKKGCSLRVKNNFTYNKNVDIKFSFWNNLHQVRSKSKDWKTK